jgi:hypothetical protein
LRILLMLFLEYFEWEAPHIVDRVYRGSFL